MDEKLIYSFWDRFDKSDAVELLYESGDSKLRLRKAEPTVKQVYNGCITSTGMPAATFGVTMPQGMQPGTFIQAGDAASAGNAAGVISTDSSSGIAGSANSVNASTKAQTADSGVFVKSPLPGTFYRSASPSDEPYVMIGSKVKQVYNGCITSTGMPAATFGVTMPQGMQPGTFIQAGDAASAGNAAGVISTDSSSGIAGSANSVNASTKAQTADSGVFVKSPLPGTFYRSASPGDEPYVMIGSKVKQGDVVGIVESMKMMNEIVAPADGTVAEILAENGSIVGYDDKLIRLS